MIAKTRIDRVRIDSAGGDAGETIDRFCWSMAVAPGLPHRVGE